MAWQGNDKHQRGIQMQELTTHKATAEKQEQKLDVNASPRSTQRHVTLVLSVHHKLLF